MAVHKYSVERLVHYQCGNEECKRWWSIGDGPEKLDGDVVLNCPHCAYPAPLEHIPSGQPNFNYEKAIDYAQKLGMMTRPYKT